MHRDRGELTVDTPTGEDRDALDDLTGAPRAMELQANVAARASDAPAPAAPQDGDEVVVEVSRTYGRSGVTKLKKTMWKRANAMMCTTLESMGGG